MKVLHVMTHFSVSSGVARLVASLIPFQIEQGLHQDIEVVGYDGGKRIHRAGE